MVLITIVTGAYKPTNITGGPHIVSILHDCLLGRFWAMLQNDKHMWIQATGNKKTHSHEMGCSIDKNGGLKWQYHQIIHFSRTFPLENRPAVGVPPF